MLLGYHNVLQQEGVVNSTRCQILLTFFIKDQLLLTSQYRFTSIYFLLYDESNDV